MSKIDLETAETVAKNLNTLMNHYDLTIYGVEAGAGVEIHTIAKVLRQSTNISTQTAKKLSLFFGIPVDTLFSNRALKLKKAENTPSIKEFYDENPLNKKYYQSRYKENVVARFLRTVLIYDSYLDQGRRAKEVTIHIKSKYKKDFNPKTVAKELARMHNEGLLNRKDKTGKGSVYLYSLK